MIIAIISDVHANYDSLIAVYTDIQKQGAQETYCLGDVIDYGPRPKEVIEFITKHNIPCIQGNHDAALFDRRVLRWFNDTAIESSMFSRKEITSEQKALLKELPLYRKVHGCYLVHAFPPDSFEIYIYEATDEELKAAFDSFSEQVCFVGHTHVLGTYELTPTHKIKKSSLTRSITLKPKHRYIINVGSTGQPRDNDNRASYVLYDTQKKQVRVRRVKYDVAAVQERIIDKGLDKENARMLD